MIQQISKWKVDPSDVNICGIRTAFIATMLFFFPGIKECPRAKDFFHFICEDRNALHWNESRFKGGLSPHMEYEKNWNVGVFA